MLFFHRLKISLWRGEIHIVTYLSGCSIISDDLSLHSHLFACHLDGLMRREACTFLFFHSLKSSP
jgi:hypothetical protein